MTKQVILNGTSQTDNTAPYKLTDWTPPRRMMGQGGEAITNVVSPPL